MDSSSKEGWEINSEKTERDVKNGGGGRSQAVGEIHFGDKGQEEKDCVCVLCVLVCSWTIFVHSWWIEADEKGCGVNFYCRTNELLFIHQDRHKERPGE